MEARAAIGRSGGTGIVLGIVSFAVALIGVLVASSGFERASRSAAASLAVGSEEGLALADAQPPAQFPSPLVDAQPSMRASVASEELLDEPPHETVDADAAREAMNAGLLAEVTALSRSGRIEAQSIPEDQSLRSFLIEHYMDMDDAQSALLVLQNYRSADEELYSAVGWALLRNGDSLHASQMFLEGLARDTSQWMHVETLISLDPVGTLALLDAKLAGFRAGATPDLAYQRARLLAAAGRLEEARAQLGEAPELGPESNRDYFDVLLEIDPDAFEEVARAHLSQSEADESDSSDYFAEYFAFHLAWHYVETDRGPEAVILAEKLLERDAADHDAIDLLFAVEPSRAYAYFEALPPEPWVPWLWDDAGDYLFEVGRIHDAVDAWMIAVRGDVFSESAVEQLKRHAPERLWAHLDRCRELAEQNKNDFVLGSIADIYWVSDRRDEAVELWQQASRIAPYDKEWTDKLRRAAAGRDPMR